MRFRRAKPTGRAPFEALYRQHHDRVYRYMMTATRADTQRAEDLTHEAFLRVWRAYGPKAGQLEEDQARALLMTTEELLDRPVAQGQPIGVLGVLRRDRCPRRRAHERGSRSVRACAR
ncbi:sigma factor [Nocardia sputi]|uniref:sigma factor n=1 Tax=Nocardia sputi TaxID=2943705 RepID=UPI0018945398|nr:sigma factor [Nocardia sputi]MBF6208326.1 hypothetical protein [Streptomyces gardneri]